MTADIDPRVFNTARGIAHEALQMARRNAENARHARAKCRDTEHCATNHALAVWAAENEEAAARWLWDQANAQCTVQG